MIDWLRRQFMIHSLVDLSLSIVRFELGQLRHLLTIIDRGIRAELNDLQVEIEATRKQRTNRSSLEDQRDDDELISVADLGRYENYTGIVMAFVIFERYLMDVLNIADSEIGNRVSDKEREFHRWSDYVEQFRSRLSIDLEADPFLSLAPYREIRNKIAHQGGQTLGERTGNQYTPGSEIPLSEEDAKRCIGLVEICCDHIYETYMLKARPHLEETARLQDACDPFEEGKGLTGR
jgi:hypothetical protein